jgi:hypothetical protein
VDLKYALFGDANASDEAMADVRRYAQFIMARREQEKN